jgi:alpha-L-fucosidase
MEHTSHPDAQWFGDAGLGLFVHWGISAVDAEGEISWSMMTPDPDDDPKTEAYFEQAERFDPDDYDPDRWLAAAKRAGMEYAVLTTKHHDGFALWPSAFGEFSTEQYCDGRDLVGEFVDACRRHGVKVGFYYTVPDWHHPSYPAAARESHDGLGAFVDETATDTDPETLAALETYYQDVQGQLRELLTRYGDVDLLWFDMPDAFWSGVHQDRIGDLYDLARSLQPGIVVNGRGAYTHWGDYATPENELPEDPPSGWWELCQTWADSWAYVAGDEYRDVDWTLRRVVDTVSRGGNLLLNVGPRADGTLPDEAYDRLDALADWMDHGEPAVKSVERGPGPARANAPVTRGDATWYVHVLRDHEGAVELRDVPDPRDVRLLRTGERPAHDHAERTLTVEVPAERPTPDEVVAVSWAGTDEPRE